MESSPRGRGRPRVGDREEISEIALRLMAERGYSATTMTDIAKAADISAPTLFRYFPSKAAVLWQGMEHTVELFQHTCREQDASKPIPEAVFAAYLDMLWRSPVRVPVIKHRVAIVTQGGAPDAAWLRFEEWREVVVAFVAERRSVAPDALEAAVIGGMIWGALWSAVSAWAASDEPDPAPLIESALGYLVNLH